MKRALRPELRQEPMNVTATRHAADKPTGAPLRAAEQHDAPASESRALVAIGPAATREPAASFREATFLAQLIATREQLPQTRERRRAEPGDAIAAYRATEALTGKH
jgi:hypothetical protein